MHRFTVGAARAFIENDAFEQVSLHGDSSFIHDSNSEILALIESTQVESSSPVVSANRSDPDDLVEQDEVTSPLLSRRLSLIDLNKKSQNQTPTSIRKKPLIEPASSTKRKKRSEVWDYFEESDEPEKVVCILCPAKKRVVLSRKGGNTSSMRDHLKSYHKDINLADFDSQENGKYLN
jgi:hypothetical protein